MAACLPCRYGQAMSDAGIGMCVPCCLCGPCFVPCNATFGSPAGFGFETEYPHLDPLHYESQVCLCLACMWPCQMCQQIIQVEHEERIIFNAAQAAAPGGGGSERFNAVF